MLKSTKNSLSRDVFTVAIATFLLAVGVIGTVHFQHRRRVRLSEETFQEAADQFTAVYRNAVAAAAHNDQRNFAKSLGTAMTTEVRMKEISEGMSSHEANVTLQNVAFCIDRLSRYNNYLNGPYAAEERERDPQLPQQVENCLSTQNTN